MKAGPSTSHGACWSFPPIRISLLSDVPVASRVRGPAEARTLSFFNSRKGGRDLKKRTGGGRERGDLLSDGLIRFFNDLFPCSICLSTLASLFIDGDGDSYFTTRSPLCAPSGNRKSGHGARHSDLPMLSTEPPRNHEPLLAYEIVAARHTVTRR